MLRLNNVSIRQGNSEIIRQFSLQLNKGERLGLLGSSGVGKTSLLQAVAGLLPVSGGTCCNGFSRLGYVFQEPRLLPWVTAQMNVALPLQARGTDKASALQQAAEWLQRLSLPRAKNQCYPAQLSGGMAQRVSLARAFALQPDLLLLDEPFSALDPALRKDLLGLCDELLTDLNCALMYVSHHPEELLPLTHQCLVLEGGNRHRQLDLRQNGIATAQSLIAGASL